MKLIIDIPEEIINMCNDNEVTSVKLSAEYFRNGTPLPKGHGELVDIRPLMRGLYEEIQVGELRYTTSEVYKMLEEETSTIIEADTER